MLRVSHATPRVLLQLTPGDWAVIVILLVAGLAIKALVLWWLYRDTTQRGREPLWWLAAAVPLDIPTLIVWLFVRPPHAEPAASHTEHGHAPTPDRAPGPGSQGGTSQSVATPPHGPSASGRDPRSATGPDPRSATGPVPSPPRDPQPNGPDAQRGQGDRVPVTCPHCSTRFHVEASLVPQRIECPGCNATGTLPATLS